MRVKNSNKSTDYHWDEIVNCANESLENRQQKFGTPADILDSVRLELLAIDGAFTNYQRRTETECIEWQKPLRRYSRQCLTKLPDFDSRRFSDHAIFGFWPYIKLATLATSNDTVALDTTQPSVKQCEDFINRRAEFYRSVAETDSRLNCIVSAVERDFTATTIATVDCSLALTETAGEARAQSLLLELSQMDHAGGSPFDKMNVISTIIELVIWDHSAGCARASLATRPSGAVSQLAVLSPQSQSKPAGPVH
jgi:hypothetical protein